MTLKGHQQSLQIFNSKAAQGVLQHLLRGCLILQRPLSGVSISESEHTTGSTVAVTVASCTSQSCCVAYSSHGECPQKTLFCSQSLSAVCQKGCWKNTGVHAALTVPAACMVWMEFPQPTLQFIWMHSSLNGLINKTSLCNREESLSQL